MDPVQERTGRRNPMSMTTQQSRQQQPLRPPSAKDSRRRSLAAASGATFMTNLGSKATHLRWQEPGALAAGNPAALLARWR